MNRKMKIMLGRCAGLALCVLAVTMLLAAQEKQNIAGKWEVNRISESGVSYSFLVFDFTSAGDTAFTGTATLVGRKPEDNRTVSISNGTIQGDKVSFDVPGFTFEGQPGSPRYPGTYTGTINGDEFKFEIPSQGGSRKLTAKRKTAG